MTWFKDIVIVIITLVAAGVFIEWRVRKIIQEELARIWPDDEID